VTREIAPWEMWWADLDPKVGPEQAGLQPAIVVGTAFACQLPNQLAFVVPCTTTDRQLPFHPQVTSLERPTFAMSDHSSPSAVSAGLPLISHHHLKIHYGPQDLLQAAARWIEVER